MIFDLRIYRMYAGKAAASLKIYEQYGLRVQSKYLSESVMFSMTAVGPLNQVIHLWKYERQADREKRRETMANEPAWGEFLKRNAEMGAIMSQEHRILKPTSFSSLR